MIQPFLIECIPKTVGLDESRKNPKEIPVSKPLLIKDLNGHPLK